MKTCPRCKKTLPKSSYHKNKARHDGLAAQCKNCKNKMSQKDYAKNIEHYRKVHNLWYKNNKDKKAIQQKKWRERNLDKESQYCKNRNEKYPEKREAYSIVLNAIRSNNLTRQPCEKCGATNRISAHHDDYSMPLDVKWLCVPCHTEEHSRAV